MENKRKTCTFRERTELKHEIEIVAFKKTIQQNDVFWNCVIGSVVPLCQSKPSSIERIRDSPFHGNYGPGSNLQ